LKYNLRDLRNTVATISNGSVTTATLGSYAPLNNPTFTGTVSGISKSMVGLGNVDNTADINKPVSTAMTTELNKKANLTGATFTGAISTSGNISTTGTGTISEGGTLLSAKYAQLGTHNTFTGNITTSGTISTTGSGAFSEGGTFLSAKYAQLGAHNTFTGNITTSGTISTTGTGGFSENGTLLSNKYAQLGVDNSFTGAIVSNKNISTSGNILTTGTGAISEGGTLLSAKYAQLGAFNSFTQNIEFKGNITGTPAINLTPAQSGVIIKPTTKPTDAQLHIVPTNDNDETVIGFYKYKNMSGTLAGDSWGIGTSSGNFAIGTRGFGQTFSISPTGNVNIPQSLSINGVTVNPSNYAPVSNPAFMGNVGIGITPSKLLDVYSGLPNSAIINLSCGAASSAGNKAALYMSPWYDSTNRTNPSSGIVAIDNGSYSADLTFLTAPSGSLQSPNTFLAERMRITADGKLGFGTTNPTHLMHMHSNVSDGAALSITGPGGANSVASIYLSPSYSPTGRLSPTTAIRAMDNNNSADLTFWTASSSTTSPNSEFIKERMRITPSGNVGIGTTAPTSNLHVYGQSFLDGRVGIYQSNPSAPLHVNGNTITSALLVNTSTAYTASTSFGTTWTDSNMVSINGNMIVNGTIKCRKAANPSTPGILSAGDLIDIGSGVDITEVAPENVPSVDIKTAYAVDHFGNSRMLISTETIDVVQDTTDAGKPITFKMKKKFVDTVNNVTTDENTYIDLSISDGVDPNSKNLNLNYNNLITKLDSLLSKATALTIYQKIEDMVDYVTNSALTTTLSSYVTNSSLTSTLLSYVTDSSLATTLSSYATLSALTNYMNLTSNQTLTGTKTFSGTLVSNANSYNGATSNSEGNIRSVATTSGSESCLGFYRNADQSVGQGGDLWSIGHNCNSVGDRVFGIGTAFSDPCLSINPSNRIITAVTGLSTPAITLNGTSIDNLYQSKPWIAARVDVSSGVATVASPQTGRVTVTAANRISAGVVELTWGSATGTNNYTVFGTIRGNPGFLSYGSTTNTTCRVLTYNTAGTTTDYSFSVFIYNYI